MKTIFILTILIVLSGCSVAFKADRAAESNQPANKSEETEIQSAIGRKSGDETESGQTNLTGTYRYKSGRNHNAIGVEELGGNRLRLHIAANYEYKDSSDEWMVNSGDASGIVTLKNGTAVLFPEGYPNCPITLKFSGNKIVVRHEGAGGDCGFGGNVTASGTYTKTSNELNQNEMIDDAPEIAGNNTITNGERIQFKPGTSSATVGGTAVGGGEETTYLLGARAGQTMTVKITENSQYNDVVFHIIAPDGSFPMGSDGESASYDTTWSGRLPKSGDYKIVVGTIESKKANFKMLVSIR
ncbi:MAG TPA: hypothetical protein VF648_21010 [Pyrinomonadaceae bacterium]|jgi:hypothetical protein